MNDVDSFKKMIKNNIQFEYNILENWYDTGNVDSYNKLSNVIKPNYYVLEKNYESLCFFENKVIKFINDKEINKKRIIRGKQLYPLSPKILNYTDNFLSMELIDGDILSDIYEYGIIYNLLNWSKQNLWTEELKKEEHIDCCRRFYITKTIDRINKLHFLHQEKNRINGLMCKNIIETIQNLPDNLLTNDTFTKFHGDFILDNIIKTSCENNQIHESVTNSESITPGNCYMFKLLDWRHEFDNQIIYGDIYYDLAKLRHNIIFNHKNILDKLFTIEYTDNNVIVDLKCNYFQIQQLTDFDKFVIENNYNLKKIKILTSIIWINMSPLYEGKLSEFLFYFGKYNLLLSL